MGTDPNAMFVTLSTYSMQVQERFYVLAKLLYIRTPMSGYYFSFYASISVMSIVQPEINV